MDNTEPTIQIVHLMPGDVIVAAHSGSLSNKEIEELHRMVSAHFPSNSILVHDSRVTLSVHRQINHSSHFAN